jgi:hypothetical protein
MLVNFFQQLTLTTLKHLALYSLVYFLFERDYLYTFLLTVAISYVYTNLIAGAAVVAVSIEAKKGEKNV